MTPSSPKNWEVLSSRITYEDRWIRLRTDRCRTESGKILESYHVVELGDWIHVLAITRDLKVVTVREYRHGAGKIVHGLPAGMLEESDPTPESGARREISEETGYAGGHFIHVGTAYANPAIQNNQVHAFLAIDLEPIEGDRELDPAESIELVIEPYSDFLRRVLAGKLGFQCLHLSGVHQALMHILGSGRPELERLRQLSVELIGRGANQR